MWDSVYLCAECRLHFACLDLSNGIEFCKKTFLSLLCKYIITFVPISVFVALIVFFKPSLKLSVDFGRIIGIPP